MEDNQRLKVPGLKPSEFAPSFLYSSGQVSLRVSDVGHQTLQFFVDWRGGLMSGTLDSTC